MQFFVYSSALFPAILLHQTPIVWIAVEEQPTYFVSVGVVGIRLRPLKISAQKIVHISAEGVNFNIRKCAKIRLRQERSIHICGGNFEKLKILSFQSCVVRRIAFDGEFIFQAREA